MTESVLVLGAGELGLAVLEALASHSLSRRSKISVLLREATIKSTSDEKKSTARRLRELDIALVSGDVVQDSVSDLAGIFGQFHTVVSCTGMGLPPGTQLKLTEAVLKGQVPRYFPWQFGMDYDIIGRGSSQDLFDEQLQVRQRLRGQDTTDWVIVSTGLFMSFLFLADFGVVDLERRTARGLGAWENRITLTSPEDIGRVTADVVLDPRDIRSQVVYTAGDTLSYQQAADIVEAHYQAPFERELWDLGILKKQMDDDPNVMVKYRETFAHERGVAWDMETTVNAQRGIAMTDVRAYLEATGMRLGTEKGR